MSTRGDYTVVKDGHYYSCYQHSAMYPNGYPVNLFAEASDIARNGDWDEVLHGWEAKAWVDEGADNDRTYSPALVAAAESHPDGGVVAGRWANMLRPRMSREELAAVFGEDDARQKIDRGQWPIYYTQPSWRAAAAMPVMEANAPYANLDREWGVFVDADHREVVLIRYRGSEGGRPVAAASMDDPDGLRSIAESIADKRSEERLARQETVPTGRDWAFPADGAGIDGVSDGMWKRPAGFPPFTGAPADYPALRAGEFAPRRLPQRTPEQLRCGSVDGIAPPLEAASGTDTADAAPPASPAAVLVEPAVKRDKAAEAVRLRRRGLTHREIGRHLGMSQSWAQSATAGVPRGGTRQR